jgi:RimJ/RimL family protein N-acetyltransferase
MSALELRQASSADVKHLFDLRNHPQVRKQSRNTDEIDFSEHKKWLKKVVLDESKRILIAEENGIFVGMTRFELIDDAYLMSWAISPSFQGHGFGKEMIEMALRIMEYDTIKAEIKKNNIASIKIAEYIGMKLTKENEGTLFYLK